MLNIEKNHYKGWEEYENVIQKWLKIDTQKINGRGLYLYAFFPFKKYQHIANIKSFKFIMTTTILGSNHAN